MSDVTMEDPRGQNYGNARVLTVAFSFGVNAVFGFGFKRGFK
jgi:hypothetical protein